MIVDKKEGDFPPSLMLINYCALINYSCAGAAGASTSVIAPMIASAAAAALPADTLTCYSIT